MGSVLEDGRKITEQPVNGHVARMDWAYSVTDFLEEGSLRNPGKKSQLERTLAERLFATFGLDNAKIVLDNTYRSHPTPETAVQARELFDQLHSELQNQSDPLALEMIRERDIAGLLGDNFRIGHGIDSYMEALQWSEEAIKIDNEDNSDDKMKEKERELDDALRQRLTEQFGPIANEVYTVLYSPLLSRDERKKELDRLRNDLTKSPWSSTFYIEVMNTASQRMQVAERVRFLLETYVPNQPNSTRHLFDAEAKIAKQVR